MLEESNIEKTIEVLDKQDIDPYAYTRRDEFTSENFKIEIKNLPNHFGYREFRKLLENKLKLKPVKIKAQATTPYCYVTFRSEEERQKAFQVLNGYKWKNCILIAKKALPKQDPLSQNLKRKQDEKTTINKKLKREEVEEQSISERLNTVVTPLWRYPYEEQLNMKFLDTQIFLKKLCTKMMKSCIDISTYLLVQRKEYDGMCCHLDNIKRSPIINGYRNKIEFSMGKDFENLKAVIGFRLGKYKGGTNVVLPYHCLHISDAAKDVVKHFNAYISKSDKSIYDHHTHKGHWKLLTLRESQLKSMMAIIEFEPQDLKKDEIQNEIDKLKTFFNYPDINFGITSLVLNICRKRHETSDKLQDNKSISHLVFGEPYLFENLIGMKFRISSNAFFQVNTLAAEILYKTIQELCKVDKKKSVVLDICCGTGTIGILLAQHAKKVIGVEMCSEAVDDAKENAKLNGAKNVEFYCGKAEDILFDVLQKLNESDIIGIVDPPRSGLHINVIHSIRKNKFINKLLYVSCDPQNAMQNFIDLCRPISNRIKGIPFKPVKAVPVDLFPHTRLCELLFLFERNS